jgi:ferredoxin-NADP reductase/(2Fe-2S) ferredoxin
MPEHHFDIHVFCCINERAAGHPRGSCSVRGSVDLQEYMKAQAKRFSQGRRIRINKSGCLDRCELGPVMVIYPEGVWYHYQTKDDIDEILESHVLNGKTVARLQLSPGQKTLRTNEPVRVALRVADMRELAHDVCRYELVAPDGSDLPAFEAGAHVDLFTGAGMRRSYSLAGDPDTRQRYVLGIRREVPSRGGSDWLLDHLSVGDRLEASLPSNNFPLDWSAKRHILIAGSIGVTPMMAMGRALRRAGASCHLHFCAPDESRAPFLSEVKEIFGSELSLYFDGGDPSKGLNLSEVLGSPIEGDHVYVCGPPGLVSATRERASHWPSGSVHWEQFAPGVPESAPPNEPFEILLSRQQVKLQVSEDQTILDAVRKAGIDIESSCEDGLCGCCRVGLLGGVPQHRDVVLTDAEKVANREILICISRAKKGEVLVLDI